MGFAVTAFLAIFVLIASGGLLLFYREAMLQRITEVINPSAKKKGFIGQIQESGLSVGNLVEHFNSVIPSSANEVSVLKARLIRAGMRTESAVRIFNGTRFLLPVALAAAAWATGLYKLSPFFVFACAFGLGFLGPYFWLGHIIKKRQSLLRKGLPDVLDLLVICIEAGLSLDQAVVRAAEELRFAQPELCDELGVVVLEQRAGRPRDESWKHLSERTDVDAIRNLVSMLIQSEQFGTSIGKTLRTHSDTLRTKRVQQVEEAAAKTTIKLIFPLVFFIFPALFLVVLGPSVIIMMESFKTFLGN